MRLPLLIQMLTLILILLIILVATYHQVIPYMQGMKILVLVLVLVHTILLREKHYTLTFPRISANITMYHHEQRWLQINVWFVKRRPMDSWYVECVEYDHTIGIDTIHYIYYLWCRAISIDILYTILNTGTIALLPPM